MWWAKEWASSAYSVASDTAQTDYYENIPSVPVTGLGTGSPLWNIPDRDAETNATRIQGDDYPVGWTAYGYVNYADYF